jgi:hypothetical protein
MFTSPTVRTSTVASVPNELCQVLRSLQFQVEQSFQSSLFITLKQPSVKHFVIRWDLASFPYLMREYNGSMFVPPSNI